MDCISIAETVDHQMAARLRMAVAKLAYANNGSSAAIAPAEPMPSIVSFFDWLGGDQLAETLACDIDASGHGDLLERLLCQVAAERCCARSLRNHRHFA